MPGKPGGDEQPRWATIGRMDDYLEVNRRNWDERAPAHAASPGYGFDRFYLCGGEFVLPFGTLTALGVGSVSTVSSYLSGDRAVPTKLKTDTATTGPTMTSVRGLQRSARWPKPTCATDAAI